MLNKNRNKQIVLGMAFCFIFANDCAGSSLQEEFAVVAKNSGQPANVHMQRCSFNEKCQIAIDVAFEGRPPETVVIDIVAASGLYICTFRLGNYSLRIGSDDHLSIPFGQDLYAARRVALSLPLPLSAGNGLRQPPVIRYTRGQVATLDLAFGP